MAVTDIHVGSHFVTTLQNTNTQLPVFPSVLQSRLQLEGVPPGARAAPCSPSTRTIKGVLRPRDAVVRLPSRGYQSTAPVAFGGRGGAEGSRAASKKATWGHVTPSGPSLGMLVSTTPVTCDMRISKTWYISDEYFLEPFSPFPICTSPLFSIQWSKYSSLAKGKQIWF